MRRISALPAGAVLRSPDFGPRQNGVGRRTGSVRTGQRGLSHIDDAAAQALNAPRNMRNQMDVAPKTKIVVVTDGDGVDFLFDGARDFKSNI